MSDDFVESAAVRMLEGLLEGLRAGRLAIVDVAATDSPQRCGLKVEWVQRADVEHAPVPVAGEPETVRPRSGAVCPDCKMGRLNDLVDTLACTNCCRQYPVD